MIKGLNTEILFRSKWLNVLRLTSPEHKFEYICTHSEWTNGHAVAVLPYQEIGGKTKYLLRQEVTPCWGMDPVLSAITGGMDKEGEFAQACAMRELLEEGGYRVADTNRWSGLGIARMSKSSTTTMHLFAVDCTGIAPEEAEGDGTELEGMAHCEWRDDPFNAQDVLVAAMIYRLSHKRTK